MNAHQRRAARRRKDICKVGPWSIYRPKSEAFCKAERALSLAIKNGTVRTERTPDGITFRWPK